MENPEKRIKAVECRFAKHISMRRQGEPDAHLVKEKIHYEDGSSSHNLRVIRGLKRPYYITNLKYRNHKQKKVMEKLERVDEYFCTQDDLVMEIQRKLPLKNGFPIYRDLAASPYLYGADLPSTSYIMERYRQKWPDIFTQHDVAVLDIETNMFTDAGEVLMIVTTNGKWLQLDVDKNIIEGFSHQPKEAIIEAMRLHIGDVVDQRGMNIEVCIRDNELEVIKAAFARLHKESPDIVAIWNMAFDIPRILDRIKAWGYDPARLLSDPSLPRELQRCYWKHGKENRTTEKGTAKSISVEEQWHKFFLSAGFQFIDQMCGYWQVRIGGQKEPGYKLTNIMNKHAKIKKLNFKEVEHIEDNSPQWHMFMQKHHMVMYCVYCMFDGIGPVILDEKTGDLRRTMPSRGRTADLAHFDSQAHKTMVRMHTVCKEAGYVFGTLGPSETRQPSDVLSRDRWIVTLKAYLISEEGLQLMEDNPQLYTLLYAMAGDDDCISSYPSDITACNISTPTTRLEIIDIDGIPEAVFRHNNINLSSGPVNAIEYCVAMFGLPDVYDMRELIKKELGR